MPRKSKPMSDSHRRSPGYCALDRQGRIRATNDSFLQTVGASREETIGQRLSDFLDAFSAELVRRNLEQWFAGKGIQPTDITFKKNRGSRDANLLMGSLGSEEDGSDGKMHCWVDTVRGAAPAKRGDDRSDRSFRSLFENATVGIYQTTVDGRILKANPALLRMLRYSSIDELATRNLEDEGFEPDYPRSEFRQKVESKGTVTGLESVWQRADGSKLWVCESARAVRDKDGNVVYYEGTVEDITERKETEQALRASEEFNRTVIENAPVGVSVRSRMGKLLSFNAAWKNIWGVWDEDLHDYLTRERSELKFDSRDDYLGDWREGVRKVYQEGGQLHIPELKVSKSRKGRDRWISQYFYGIQSDSGQVDRVVILTEDVTERRRIERVLHDKESEHAALIDKLPIGVFRGDASGIITSANPAVAEFLGLDSPDELIGKAVTPFYVDPSQERRLLKRLCAAGFQRDYDIQIEQPNGELRWGRLNALAERDASGQIIHLTGTVEDITERRQARQALRESEERFRRMTELAPEGFFEIDLEGRFEFANVRMLEYFGWSENDFAANARFRDTIALKDQERVCENMNLVTRGEPIGLCSYRGRRRDGSEFPVTMNAVSIIRDGEAAGVRGIVVDVTEQKLREQELLKALKLESVGVLAGGIAHDFNNLLTGILGNVTLAKDDLPPDTETYAGLEEAERIALRAGDLTQQLLTFSRGGDPVRKAASVNRLVGDTASLALRGSNVALELSLTNDIPPVRVDTGQLSQVIHNIVHNAEQAMPEGGVVTVSTNSVRVDSDSPLPLREGLYILLTIRDCGCGIAAGDVGKIFDPYFTTRSGASGLGLSTAYSIINKHEGHIEIESAPMKGTSVAIYLPAPVHASDEELSNDRDSGSEQRILVMDDESYLRAVASKTLEKDGYAVDCAADGATAIELFRAAREEQRPYSLVILDLTVPGGMGGRETVARLRKIDPNVRAVVCSGYSNHTVMSDCQRYGFCGVVAKPFHPQALRDTVASLLRQTGTQSA